MKIGMALTRRRQPRKAVGTQILCKRTRARACARPRRTFLLVFDLGRVSRVELSRAHDRAPICIGVYVRGNWLSTLPAVQQPYGAQPDSWECGLRIVIALSNSIPHRRAPELCVSPLRFFFPSLPCFHLIFFLSSCQPLSLCNQDDL